MTGDTKLKRCGDGVKMRCYINFNCARCVLAVISSSSASLLLHHILGLNYEWIKYYLNVMQLAPFTALE